MAISLMPSAVALGLFDGVHLGHRRVLELVLAQKSNGMRPSVFTFATESVGVKHNAALDYLYPTEQKCAMLRECGMEHISHHPFAEICDMEGEEFVREILVQRFAAGFVCCGEDFRFGRHAAWDTQDLRRFGAQYGFSVQTAKPVCVDGEIVSSSRIRSLLQSGEVSDAERLLGAPYSIELEVVHGAQLGRTIGFPTMNQVFADGQLVPRFGVYASRTVIDGVSYPSVTNVGRKPTVQYDGRPLAETYVIGAKGDFYGRTIPVALLDFIRPEQKFDSLEALTAQLHKDLEIARAYGVQSE